MIKWMILFLPVALLHAQTTPPERITEITSERLHFDYARKKAIFIGNVQVNDPDITITAEKMTVTLTAQDQVEKIEAEGKVVIKMEGMSSRSGRAVYIVADSKVVLEDNPQVSRQGSILQAEKITYWRVENRLLAEPNVRMLNIQEDGRDRQIKL